MFVALATARTLDQGRRGARMVWSSAARHATPHGLPRAQNQDPPMNPPDARWLKAHSGPLSTRRMAAAIDRIAAFVEGKDHLAVTKVAQQQDPCHDGVPCRGP